MTWRMTTPCEDCPFNKTGPGARLRRSLARGRFAEILCSLKTGEWFVCHKTAEETGDGSNLMCAGAIEWQSKRGVSSNFQRIMERLHGVARKA